jgi:phosphohistidine phosphatase
MTLSLYLLRHAETEPWNPLGNDFSRSLTAPGGHHAARVSAWALNALAPPDTILCSPAKRTRETLSPFLAQWPQLLATTDYVDSLYNASFDLLLTLAQDAFSYSRRLMMVGHKPGIEQMLNGIVLQEDPATAHRMAPGTLAVIEFSERFKSYQPAGRLLHLVKKSDLSAD